MILVARVCFCFFALAVFAQLVAYNAMLGAVAGLAMSGAAWAALLDRKQMRLYRAVKCLEEIADAPDTEPQDRYAARRMRDLLNSKI